MCDILNVISSEDLLITGHHAENNEEYYNAVVPPIFMNSLNSYKNFKGYNTGRYVYTRSSNATTEIIEKKLAALEHGIDAIFFASGMGAISTAIMHATSSGGHVICQKSVYEPDKDFLKKICKAKLNISVSFIDMTNLDELRETIQDNTQLIIMESPATFVFEIIDIEGVVAIAKEYGVKTFLDNTWCTPLLQKPLDYGVDYVMHTASKYLGGHSDIVGGCLVVKDENIAKDIKSNYRALFGGIIGPMESWLILRGLRTLALRVKAHGETALEVATFLEGHQKVGRVYCPGLPSCKNYKIGQKQMKGITGLLGFELKDKTPEEAVAFIDRLNLFQKGCSWGGFESLALTPLCYESDELVEQFGCSRGIIRIFCGLEGTAALIDDLKKALEKV